MEDYDFNHSPFWVRVSNIPMEYMDRDMALEVGNAIGEVLAIDWRDGDGGWTEYMRIRINIDINKPLRRVVHYIDHEGEEFVFAIRYEKLPRFCYICGLIGHTTQKCKEQMINNESQDNIFQYGNWLKVPVRVINQNNGLLRNGIEMIKEDNVNDRKSYRKFCKDELDVTIQSYSKHHIDFTVKLGSTSIIRVTGYYGHANPSERNNSWNMLRRVGEAIVEKTN
ncbi:hypothetical protein GOBAR_DD35844 [Gossypium barbadense]|nr:hypothetical protein GOBAR_DD35844 [Gossypium barbadense]